jgi:predicted RNA-binding Zn-ribbon protein involved in translation (DUF1610 family)
VKDEDDSLIDSWQAEHLKDMRCPSCGKILPPSVTHSMLRVVYYQGGRRRVQPGKARACPNCGEPLRLKFGTTLGKITYWVLSIIAILFLVMSGASPYGQSTITSVPYFLMGMFSFIFTIIVIVINSSYRRLIVANSRGEE